MDTQQRIKEQVTANRVVLYMKGTPQFPQCGFSGQVVQILASLSGSGGNVLNGSIDFRLGLVLSVIEVLGVWIGVKVAHSVAQRTLRLGVGALCIAVGFGLLGRTLWPLLH